MYLTLIVLPLLGSIVSGFFGRKVGVSGAHLITCTSVITTTFLAILAFFEVGFNNIPVTINVARWIDVESLYVLWNFRFDSLTVCFVALFCEKGIEAVLVLIQLHKFISISSSRAREGTKKSLSCRLGYSSFRPYNLYHPNHYFSKGIKYYSTTRNNVLLSESFYSNFLQWFVGFSDAEGNFNINRLLNKDKLTIASFSFMFKISLHKDDDKVLRYINDMLGVGGVRFYKNECIFSITDMKGINLLISIFDKYNLNTTKYLDYLDFKEAFIFYTKRDKGLKPETVKDKVLELKNNMNTNRVQFDRPKNSDIVITKSWLLGFIEGDGSLFLRRDTLTPTFCIEISGTQLPVLIKIKEFLENYLGFNKYSLYKLKNSSTIAISTVKARTINSKSSATLIIENIYVLNNYFIPFFADKEFLTKKGKDFNDFKTICNVIYEGGHRKEEIRSLILKLSNTMNNFRLSTNKVMSNYLSKEETEKLLFVTPTFEHLIDGRVIDRETKKVLPQQNSCVYEISEQNGVFFLTNSLSEAAAIIGLYPDTLSKYLDIEILNPEDVFVEIKNYKIRRVCVFYPIK